MSIMRLYFSILIIFVCSRFQINRTTCLALECFIGYKILSRIGHHHHFVSRHETIQSRHTTLFMNLSRKGQTQIESFSNSMNTVKQYIDDVPPLMEDPSLSEVYTIVMAADARKAQGISALRVSQLTVITNFMVILEGTSRPQNQAIAANIIELMEEKHGRVVRQQGTPDSGWILLDYGDIIVHVMTPKSRSYYDLESFWSAGEKVDLKSILIPNGAPRLQSDAKTDYEEDPFWS